MTNTEVIGQIITQMNSFVIFMLPIIGFLSGLMFMVTWAMSVIPGFSKRTFRG